MGSAPPIVIMDSPSELRRLRAWLGDPNMPSIDIAMLFQTLYEAIAFRDKYYQMALYHLATRMAHHDLLIETNTLSQMDRDELELMIINAGHAIARQLEYMRLYHPTGQLLYRFREYRNDSTLIFELAPLTR